MTKKAILLVNLGSPKSPQVKDVKPYLKEFLMDKYVIDVTFLLRWFLVNLIIIPKRVESSAKAYQSVWTEEGSPLIVISHAFQKAIQDHLDYPVYLAMRYQEPSIESVMKKMLSDNKKLEEIVLCPLYPQYAMSTTLTVEEEVNRVKNKLNKSLSIKTLPPFYKNPLYIDVLANSIKPYIKNESFVLFSYHGLPERHLMKTDPTKSHCLKVDNCCQVSSDAHNYCYFHQIKQTTEYLAERCNLNKNQYQYACQSRLGNDPWIRPYTDEAIHSLLEKGIKHLVVVSPAFVADCLETIEELGDELKEDWLENGGESFELVPCLNTNKDWVMVFAQIIKGFIGENASR